MDIKSKNNNPVFNKFITSLIILAITAATALGICKAYPMIEKAGAGKEYNYFETDSFRELCIRYLYGIDYELLALTDTDNRAKPSDVVLDKDKTAMYGYDGFYGDSEELSEEYSGFNQYIYELNQNIHEYYSNLKYYALNKDNNKSITNLATEVNLVKDNKLDLSLINQEAYRFIMQLDFDENGYVSTSNIKGAEPENINFRLDGYLESVTHNTGYYFKPIKNTSIIFAVNNEMEFGDGIAYGVKYGNTHMYETYGIGAGLIAIAIVVLAALIMPYKKVKDFNILKTPFEIWGVIIVFDIAAFVLMETEIIGETIINNSIKIGELVLKKDVIMLGNFAAWFMILLVAFFGMTVIKSIFKEGVGEYFKTRSLIGRIITYLFKEIKKTVHYITEVDLREDNNKYILKLVLINALILLIITSIWIAGIPFVLIYSVVLFFVIRKYVDDISSKYKRLTEATNEIAEGNLDVKIEDDLGVFNPFKDNLEKIQGGFKKAVQEEVKSQKMKTDLISNVSHDLKTPLTAIITYVDLLKDENLSAEKRKEYLAIVDRKSQRLQELIEDLFEISKASSGNINLNIEQVDIVSLMKQSLFELDDKLKEANLSIKTNYSAEKIILALDSQRTYRVFENLILNTAKYAMKNTRVYVDIIEENKNVKVIIKNIAAEEIDFNENEIVERFVRGDKSRNTEGSGLGLAIAKSFVELQGGKFKIGIDGDLFKAIITFRK